jgi:hypothetical protein
MIRLRTLLAEQLDDSGELIGDDIFTDDMKQEYVKKAETMADEGDSDSLDILSLMGMGDTSTWVIAGGILALLIPWTRKRLGKAATGVFSILRSGIIKVAPGMTKLLYLRNTAARIKWVKESLLKPIDRKIQDLNKQKTTGKRGNTTLTTTEIKEVEADLDKWQKARNAVNNVSDETLTTFSQNAIRILKKDSYNALRTLRDKSAKVTPAMEKELEMVFDQLKRLDDKAFDQRYVKATLESLKVEKAAKDRIINNVFGAEIAAAEKEATTAAQLAQFNKTAQDLMKRLNSSDPAIRKQAEIESQLQKMSLRNASPNTPAQQTQIKNIIDDIETVQAASQTSKPTLTFAQNNYMMTIPISERPQFASIVNNLSAEINKRSKYVDDLMAYNQFPSQKEWRGLLQSKGDDILAADLIGQSLQYNNDKLFYHANKHSGSTIK